MDASAKKVSAKSQAKVAGQSTAVSKPSIAWDFKVQFLKGVGEKVGDLLNHNGIYTLWDLVLLMPRSYEDRRRFFTIDEMIEAAETNQTVMGRATIESYSKKFAGFGGKRFSEAQVTVDAAGGGGAVDGGSADCGGPAAENRERGFGSALQSMTFTWFNEYGGSLAKQFPPGTSVIFRGKVQNFRGRLQIVHPELMPTDRDIPFWEKNIVPVYREISGLSSKFLRKIMAQAIERPEFFALPECLPLEVVERLKLPDFRKSLRQVHFPTEWEPDFAEPRPGGAFYFRIVFEELFMMALALHFRRAEWKKETESQKEQIPRIDFADADLVGWESGLPFKLTADQTTALSDVMEDLRLRRGVSPMHRLVQGDVGSGKTVVAFLAAIAAMESGFQVAMMAPTEILADQHFQSFQKLFPELAGQAILLKGALTEKKKREVRAGLEAGEYRFVIGTQALLTDTTLFARLGFVIVDEQHRFGVEQRLGLKRQSHDLIPHLLVMTATPIPRSLALTLYGDLSLSTILHKPAGRQAIETHVLKERQKPALIKRIKQFIEEGRQIYLVYPLVDESEDLDLKDVKNAHRDWSSELVGTAVGLLHGQMKSKDKEQAMIEFKAGRTRVLVATTVIEVGVDVPNASVIVIEHAERFGLSQLHQLRGRVGRGSTKSYCVLVGPDKMSERVEERLRTLEQSDDGFMIAEKDLDIRGPGEFLGRRQSGMPGFRVAHILRDLRWMELAREEARKLLASDPSLDRAENRAIKRMVGWWWQGRMELTLSG